MSRKAPSSRQASKGQQRRESTTPYHVNTGARNVITPMPPPQLRQEDIETYLSDEETQQPIGVLAQRARQNVATVTHSRPRYIYIIMCICRTCSILT